MLQDSLFLHVHVVDLSWIYQFCVHDFSSTSLCKQIMQACMLPSSEIFKSIYIEGLPPMPPTPSVRELDTCQAIKLPIFFGSKCWSRVTEFCSHGVARNSWCWAATLRHGCFNAHLAATSILLGEILLEVSERLRADSSRLWSSIAGNMMISFLCMSVIAISGAAQSPLVISFVCSVLRYLFVKVTPVYPPHSAGIRRQMLARSLLFICLVFNRYLLCLSGSFCGNFSVFTLKRALKASKAKRSRICLNGSWNNLGQFFWFLDWNHDSMDANFETPVAVQELTNFETGETMHVSIAIHVVCSNPNPHEARVQHTQMSEVKRSWSYKGKDKYVTKKHELHAFHSFDHMIEYNAELRVSRGEDSDRYPWPCLCWWRQRLAVILLHVSRSWILLRNFLWDGW